jgi:glycosyltransferase involved in cell wall biosynthesis
LGAARNAGVLCSSGDFVAFLDADDLWMSAKLQRVFQHIMDLEGGVDVICHFEDMQREGISLHVLRHGPYTTYLDLLFKGNTLSPSATSVRRSMLMDVGLFSLDKAGHGAEDWDLWLKLAKNHARIHYIKEVLGIYVLYGSNMSEAPDFHKRGRYVFESHVSRLHPISSELRVRIKGARAILELHSAKNHVNYGQYGAAMASVLAGIFGGILNSFFWSRLSAKSFSVIRRAVG